MTPLLSAVLLTAALLNVANGMSCYVCSSVNGSDPECEADLNESKSTNLLRVNCRSLIGASDPRSPMSATACITLLGELFDRKTKEFKTVISRKCTASHFPEFALRNAPVRCGFLMESDGHLTGETQFITGCTEACFENGCNGEPTYRLGYKFSNSFKNTYENEQKVHHSKLRFPSVFAVEENKRLSVGKLVLQQSSAGCSVANMLTFLLMVFICLF